MENEEQGTNQTPAPTQEISSGTDQSNEGKSTSSAYKEEPTTRTQDEAASSTDFSALADEPDELTNEVQPEPEAEKREAAKPVTTQQEDKTEEKKDATTAGEEPVKEAAGEKEATPAKTPEPAKEEQKQETTPQTAEKPETEQPKLTPEQQKEAYDKWFNESVTKIADEYTMSDEEYAEYEADPRVALPKLAAKVTIKAIEAVAANNAATFPRMFNQYALMFQAQQRDLDDFYTAWPELKDEQALTVLSRVGPMYRNLHPNASKEQYIKEVGAQIMFMLGRAKSDQDRAAEKAANGQGRVEAPVRLPSNTAPVTPERPKVTNIFEEMALDGDDAF